MTNDEASTARRTGALLAGLLCCAVGFFVVMNASQAMVALVEGSAGSWYTRRDVVYVAMWCVFALSVLAAGVSLAYSAVRGRGHNMVPGPTLYVAGASLFIIALFLVAGGALLVALVFALIGAVLMIIEYGSDAV